MRTAACSAGSRSSGSTSAATDDHDAPRHRSAVRRARNRPGRYDPEYRASLKAQRGRASRRRPPGVLRRASPEAAMTSHPRTSPLTATELVDEYFIENRTKLLEIAAFLDRLDRADPGLCGPPISGCRRSARRLPRWPARGPHRQGPDAPQRSDDRAARARSTARARVGAFDRESARTHRGEGPVMKYIDHHAHMVSRTTDDYQQMALTGCVAVTEPAFWAGWDRSTATASRTTSASSPTSSRGARRSTASSTTRGSAMNPKESDNRELSREVLQRHAEVPRSPDGARHRRDRPEPRHAQRDRDLHRTGRAGDRAPAARS